MTRPVAGGSVARSHDVLLVVLAALLLVRGILGVVDTWMLARTGTRFVPLDGAIIGGSPGWAGLWAVDALVAALSLLRRQAVGWLLAAAACAAYLATGLGDAALFSAAGTVPAGAWTLVAIDVVGPALALGLLIAVRPWFLATARRPGRRRG